MSTRIGYDAKNKPFGQMLAETVDEYKMLREKLNRLKDVMDSMASGGSFNVIEVELGSDPNAGQTVYNIVAGCKVALDAVAFQDLTRLDQG